MSPIVYEIRFHEERWWKHSAAEKTDSHMRSKPEKNMTELLIKEIKLNQIISLLPF